MTGILTQDSMLIPRSSLSLIKSQIIVPGQDPFYKSDGLAISFQISFLLSHYKFIVIATSTKIKKIKKMHCFTQCHTKINNYLQLDPPLKVTTTSSELVMFPKMCNALQLYTYFPASDTFLIHVPLLLVTRISPFFNSW